MFHQPIEADPTPHPASKWTPQVRVRFLEHLSRKGNVRAACLLIGVSTETAYRLRRRDRAFARGWDAAIVHARRAAEHVLADRAIDGVLVDIYHRGEWVASQRKYDTRLLLAHLARLDQQVKAEAEADAERFDEILAGIAGEPVPAEFAGEDEVLGLDRESFAGRAALIARLEAERTAGEEEEHPRSRSARPAWSPAPRPRTRLAPRPSGSGTAAMPSSARPSTRCSKTWARKPGRSAGRTPPSPRSPRAMKPPPPPRRAMRIFLSGLCQ